NTGRYSRPSASSSVSKRSAAGRQCKSMRNSTCWHPKCRKRRPLSSPKPADSRLPSELLLRKRGFLLRKRPFVQQKTRKIEMEIQIKTQPLKKQDFMDINHQTIMG